jgi:hypothetical protein
MKPLKIIAAYPVHFSLLDLIVVIISWDKKKYEAPHYPISSSPPQVEIFSSAPVLKHSQFMFFL